MKAISSLSAAFTQMLIIVLGFQLLGCQRCDWTLFPLYPIHFPGLLSCLQQPSYFRKDFMKQRKIRQYVSVLRERVFQTSGSGGSSESQPNMHKAMGSIPSIPEKRGNSPVKRKTIAPGREGIQKGVKVKGNKLVNVNEFGFIWSSDLMKN